jgi:hypothetical protein
VRRETADLLRLAIGDWRLVFFWRRLMTGSSDASGVVKAVESEDGGIKPIANRQSPIAAGQSPIAAGQSPIADG